jgi:hypothetical protein
MQDVVLTQIDQVIEKMMQNSYKTLDVNFYMFVLTIVVDIIAIIEECFHDEKGVVKKYIARKTGEYFVTLHFPTFLDEYNAYADNIIETFITSFYLLKEHKIMDNCVGCFGKCKK